MKEIAAENWGVCGKQQTGKTHITLEFAREIQKLSHKPILVYDSANNASYKDITNTLDIETLENYALEDDTIWKISGFKDFEYFLEVLTMIVRNTIVVLDDCGRLFRSNLTDIQMEFVTSTKNNGNDVFYQFHNFNDIGPILCRTFQMIILKEQAGSIPSKVQGYERLNILHNEIMLENEKLPPKRKWAYRVYDIDSDEVYLEDHNGVFTQIEGSTYFKNKKYKKS